ncbi:hypothetical protein [Aeropyrum camini]|uniref:Uncharacterized protein n=1 Tax=Aeropyrum camini SY1 = JCM 12091 TaxID=1198449 RepID=U3TC25_9CREN|nr:hypothetical protein [Aeropyrum camini]BAN89590.1 hypothetical protein ACAM_0121 [Aeropyrum camini SY1 = JCM 12091]
MSEIGAAGLLRPWHVIVALMLLTSVAAGFVDLEPTVEGFMAERQILYYGSDGSYVVELFSGIQVGIGGDAARIPGYNAAAACSGNGFAAALVIMAEPYLVVYTGGDTVKTVYIGGSFSGLSCSDDRVLAASIRGDGTGVVAVYENSTETFKMFLIRGLEEELSRYYNPSKLYTRNNPSWGDAVPIAPGFIAVARGDGVEVMRVTAGDSKISLVGVYSDGDSIIAYGSLDSRGFIADLERGYGMVLGFSHTVRVIAATSFEDGKASFILEHVGSGVDVGVLGEEGDGGFYLMSLRRVSITEPYSLRGAWASGGMVWITAGLVGELGGYKSIAIGLEGFGVGVISDGERHIARLLPTPSEHEASARSINIMVEKLPISRGDTVTPTVLESSAIEPIDLKSTSFTSKGGFSIENVMTALAALAPWAAVVVATLDSPLPQCPRMMRKDL